MEESLEEVVIQALPGADIRAVLSHHPHQTFPRGKLYTSGIVMSNTLNPIQINITSK